MQLTAKHLTLLVLAIIVIASPVLFPSNYYYRVGSLIFVNGLAVTGIVILTGYAGQISLGHAGFAGIGAYACALAPIHLGLHPALAAMLGAVVSGAVAWVVGRPILRLKGYYLAVATPRPRHPRRDGARQRGLADRAGRTGSRCPTSGCDDLLEAVGLDLSNAQFWYFFSGLVLLLGAWIALNLYDSPTGRALRALHGSEVAARTVGIDVARMKLQAFVISAVYASLSGSLLALQNKFITPDVAGFMHSIEMVTMAVLGGVGSVLGAFFGAAILTTLPQVLTVFQEYEQILLGLVMMLVMIFMRDGLLPSIVRAHPREGRMTALLAGRGPRHRLRRPARRQRRRASRLRPGEIVSVIGPNGAGKTTLFNMISGVYRPGSGRVVLDGEEVTGIDPYLLARRGLSRTFQNLQIFQAMSVLENAIAGYHLRERGPVARRPARPAVVAAARRRRPRRRARAARPRRPRRRRRAGGERALLRRAEAAGDRPGAGARPPRPAARRARGRLQRRRDRGDRPPDRRGRGLAASPSCWWSTT